MNWRLVISFSVVLVALPTVVGFLFGVTNTFWHSMITAKQAYLAQQAVIGLAILLTYYTLAVKYRERTLAHISLVFVVSEAILQTIQSLLGGSLMVSVGWLLGTAALASLAYLVAVWSGSTKQQAA